MAGRLWQSNRWRAARRAAGGSGGEVAPRDCAAHPWRSFPLPLCARGIPWWRIVLGPGDRDDVQCVVELAVAAAVEPVLGALSRGAGDRRGARLLREARLRAKPLVAGGVADQDRGGQRPAALLFQQPGAVLGDDSASSRCSASICRFSPVDARSARVRSWSARRRAASVGSGRRDRARAHR